MLSQRHLSDLLLLIGTTLVVACADTTDVVCPAGFVPTIVIEVWDAGANVPAARDARGAAWRDSELDSLTPAPGVAGDSLLLLWNNRPGTYAVEVRTLGFRSWDTSGVEVRSTGGPCPMVITERIAARLDSL